LETRSPSTILDGRRRLGPLQNRVTPTGEIVSDPARGLFTGNRGCLHGLDRQLGTARWRSKLWICCVLDWKGVRRDPMPPGRWTMLFFLDEATALAAGHRPCAYCRRADFNTFAEAWRKAFRLDRRPRAAEIDEQLHAERVDSRTREQRTRPVWPQDVSDGVMLRYEGTVGLLLEGKLWPWTLRGYEQPLQIKHGARAELLTPTSTAATIAAGYLPVIHPTRRHNAPDCARLDR
jgi:hypothetical protein